MRCGSSLRLRASARDAVAKSFRIPPRVEREATHMLKLSPVDMSRCRQLSTGNSRAVEKNLARFICRITSHGIDFQRQLRMVADTRARTRA